MNNRKIKLFQGSDGNWITPEDILDTLKKIGVQDCEVLFIQMDIVFGRPNRNIRKKELLQILADIFLELKIPTILLPTFTFSFPNNQIYDVNHSKTSMGVLIEYMRKLPQVSYRTLDPLLSLAVLGKSADNFYHLPHNSLGPGSAFDRIHHMKNVKFLMFGGEFGESFTYVHHVEKMLDVPYRYDQIFAGLIKGYDGITREESWTIHTACAGIKPRNFYYFEDYLIQKGFMKKAYLGDGKVVCVSETDVYREIENMLIQNPYYFLERPYTDTDLVHEYKYGKNGELVTHC